MRLASFIPRERPGAARAGAVLFAPRHDQDGALLVDLLALRDWLADRRSATIARLGLREMPAALPAVLAWRGDALDRLRELLAVAVDEHAEELRAAPAPVAYAPGTVRLLAPIPEPPSVRDFYAFEQHVRAARARRGLDMAPEWYRFPVFYFSNPASMYGPDDVVPYPRGSNALDYELEVACVVKDEVRNVSAARAAEHIAGYTILNDWSARDLQREEMTVGLGPAKGKDFATSLGPYLVTPDELEARRVGDRHDLAMVARVNGRERSRGNLADLFWTFPQMIERASANTRLRPGDVLGSGTVGTGCLLELGADADGWLQPGDVVELEVEGLGVLRNVVGGR